MLNSNRCLFIILLFLFIPFSDSHALDAPNLKIEGAAGKIHIDGDLNEPGWAEAAVITDFLEMEPGDQVTPAVKTEARVTYDDDNLYLSAICEDNPSDVRASFCDRDDLQGNDGIVWMIDTYGKGTWAYSLAVNPFGVQWDAVWTVMKEDVSYNIVFESAGRVTDSGYQVEIALPFSSLHFPDQEIQRWKVNIRRIRPRERFYEYAWAPHDRNNPCWPCQWGTFENITGVQSRRGLEILPSVVGYQIGESGGAVSAENPYSFDNHDPDGEMGLNIKFRPGSNVSVEATVNPDFNQIEPDAAQIDLNTTSALYYPERRPFFQEASELFYTWRMVYYSRMINDPTVALKGSGTIGRTDFGYILARDEHSPMIRSFPEASATLLNGSSTVNVARLRHTFAQDNYAGILITHRHLDGGAIGANINCDGQIRLHKNWRFQWQAIASYTREPKSDDHLNSQIDYYIKRDWIDSTFDNGRYTALFDGESFSGHNVMVNLEERSRYFHLDLGYLEVSPTYQSELGFQRTNNWRSLEVSGGYIIYFADSWIERLRPVCSFSSQWDFNGRKRYQMLSLGLRSSLSGQLTANVYYNKGRELYRGIDFKDIWDTEGSVSKSFSEQVYISGSIKYGQQISRSQRELGREVNATLSAYLRPDDRLLLEPEYEYLKSTHAKSGERLYEGYILRAKTTYFFGRKLNIRLIAQYNDIYRTLNIDPMITYRANPFTVFYVGSSYEYCDWLSSGPDMTEHNRYLNRRQFFVKGQYLFQL